MPPTKPNNNINKYNRNNMNQRVKTYKDPGGLTIKELNFGLWYVEHINLFKKILYSLLILLAVVSWGYTSYSFIAYYANGMKQDDLTAAGTVKQILMSHSLLVNNAPQDFIYFPAQVFKSSDNKYDMIAELKNPNHEWMADYQYYFITGVEKTETKSGFIYPDGDKYLAALAQNLGDQAGETRLIIDNLRWHRINKHVYKDWNNFYETHYNFTVENQKFSLGSSNGRADKIRMNDLSFNIINNTAYNYWQVDCLFLIYNGDMLEGVNMYEITKLMSQENRPVDFIWPGNFTQVNKIVVIPEVDIINQANYVKFNGNNSP